jgi:4-aminobutyrate aminotransferase-like enzyme
MVESAHTRYGKMVNGFNPASDYGQLDTATQAFLKRRAQLLGPAYRVFYKKPVQISHGRGALLYDNEGNEYLDAYNNVSSVGHGNKRVADAVHRQLQKLCTHTRYLHEDILTYADQLLATCDGGIGATGHAMFTCTGSEANDLALRIAKHYTRKRGIIVTAEAYHGNSDLTSSFSPSLGENSPLGNWVRQVPPPDSYRVSAKNLGEWFAEQVAAQIADLERHGDGLAAFIADSLFSSDGIFSHPTDVLGPVAEVVRRAGGLFVADEVQSGFARSGEKFWGYQRHHVDPDIVSMGKPMGNGFPVAGVLVRPEIVERFGEEVRYFNTFGGNAVAIAAAQATLDAIRDENLQANAERVGGVLRNGLKSLKEKFAMIGDVRGAGLYIGVEIIKDRVDREPDPHVASAIVNGLRERRVLISATGYHANTLKIRPPLVFTEHHGTRLLTEMEYVLKSIR